MVYGKAVYQIISFGKGYGKTRLIEELITKAKQENYRVVVIKHAHRGVDVKGKDSQRFIEAGANVVMLVSDRLQAIFVRKGYGLLENLLATFNIRESLIFIEGFKELKGHPKIVLVRDKEELLKAKKSFGKECFLIVNIGKDELESSECKVFTLKDIDEIFKTIINHAKMKIVEKDLPGVNCGYCGYPTCIDFAEAVLRGEKDILECPLVTNVELKINGVRIPLSPYPRLVIYETVKGLVKSLKGVPENIENLELRISYGKEKK